MLTSLRLPPETARYLIVGVTCASVNNVILIGGAFVGLHYMLCIVLAIAVVLPASYLVHSGWTFSTPLCWAGFGRFVLGSASSALIASASVTILCGVLAWPMLVAAPAATVAMTLYNFIMTCWAVRQQPTPL